MKAGIVQAPVSLELGKRPLDLLKVGVGNEDLADSRGIDDRQVPRAHQQGVVGRMPAAVIFCRDLVGLLIGSKKGVDQGGLAHPALADESDLLVPDDLNKSIKVFSGLGAYRRGLESEGAVMLKTERILLLHLKIAFVQEDDHLHIDRRSDHPIDEAGSEGRIGGGCHADDRIHVGDHRLVRLALGVPPLKGVCSLQSPEDQTLFRSGDDKAYAIADGKGVVFALNPLQLLSLDAAEILLLPALYGINIIDSSNDQSSTFFHTFTVQPSLHP